jgi:hypothetical protein
MLDTGLGGKGGEGGGNEGVPKMVLHDSIFSCDRRRSRRMRSFLRSFLIYFFFLDLASCNLRVREDFFTKQEIRSFLVYFSFLDSALKSMSFHIIQTLVSLRQ